MNAAGAGVVNLPDQRPLNAFARMLAGEVRVIGEAAMATQLKSLKSSTREAVSPPTSLTTIFSSRLHTNQPIKVQVLVLHWFTVLLKSTYGNIQRGGPAKGSRLRLNLQTPPTRAPHQLSSEAACLRARKDTPAESLQQNQRS